MGVALLNDARPSLIALLVFHIACVGAPPTSLSTSAPSEKEQPRAAGAPDLVMVEERCTEDSDCVVTDFPGCCACCNCSTPYAMNAQSLQKQKDNCALVECVEVCDEECLGCPFEPLGRAQCDAGRCTRRP
ncbi:MAG: hypothetical protein AAGA56_05640 [Myxococcota bacterium]